MTTQVETHNAPVEQKLFSNRYIVDGGRPHIVVKPHVAPSKQLLSLTRVCPAGCYTQTEQGQVEISTDGLSGVRYLSRDLRAHWRHRVEVSARRLRRHVQVWLSRSRVPQVITWSFVQVARRKA